VRVCKRTQERNRQREKQR